MTNQQAINILKGLEQSLDDYCELNDEGKAAFRMAIEALELFGNSERLPSAQPERKTGRWIDGSIPTYAACSECGYQERYAYENNYCPNCGARMMRDKL